MSNNKPSKEERYSNMLYTALRENRPLPKELKGTGLYDEVQALLTTIEFLRERVKTLEKEKSLYDEPPLSTTMENEARANVGMENLRRNTGK